MPNAEYPQVPVTFPAVATSYRAEPRDTPLGVDGIQVAQGGGASAASR